MKLEEARADFEAGMHLDDTLPKADAIEICSGGRRLPNGDIPALFLSPERAVMFWLLEAEKIQLGSAIRWIAEPKLERFHTTISDDRHTQRLAADRYAVIAKLVVAERK